MRLVMSMAKVVGLSVRFTPAESAEALSRERTVEAATCSAASDAELAVSTA